MKPETQAESQPTGQTELSLLLDQIEQRANAATSGPWRMDESSVRNGVAIRPGITGYLIATLGRDNMLYRDGKQRVEDDAVFIASARTDVPALVKALREVIKAVESVDVLGVVGCDGRTSWPVRDELYSNLRSILEGKEA